MRATARCKLNSSQIVYIFFAINIIIFTYIIIRWLFDQRNISIDPYHHDLYIITRICVYNTMTNEQDMYNHTVLYSAVPVV